MQCRGGGRQEAVFGRASGGQPAVDADAAVRGAEQGGGPRGATAEAGDAAEQVHPRVVQDQQRERDPAALQAAAARHPSAHRRRTLLAEEAGEGVGRGRHGHARLGESRRLRRVLSLRLSHLAGQNGARASWVS